MIALVTGGNGFLGGALVRRLEADGHEVRSFGHRAASGPTLPNHVSADLGESALLRAALEGVDAVFHFAWSSVPQTSNADPEADLVNLQLGLRLLNACVQAGVRRVVFPSSGGTVYGISDLPAIGEDAPTRPISAYGVSKLTFESYLELYRHLHGLDHRILRISNAYGPGQRSDRPQGLVSVSLDLMLRDAPITVWGDGTAVRDYVYVDDIVDACVAAADSDAGSSVFNVSSGVGHSVNDVLSRLASLTGIDPEVRYRPARDCDAPHVVLDRRRIEAELGWAPAVGFEEGVARTVRATLEELAESSAGVR